MTTIAQSFKLRLDRLPRKQLLAELRKLGALIRLGEATRGQMMRHLRVKEALIAKKGGRRD